MVTACDQFLFDSEDVRLSCRIVICLGTIIILGIRGYAEEVKRDHQQMQEATRLQIFLDNSNFAPGKIDGKDGEFTRKAVALFKRSKGQADSTAADAKTPIDTSGLDLTSVDPVFTTYVVTKEDIENVGKLPSDPAAKARMKWLPYASVAEAVAEKFHCDIDFLKELNPTVTEALKEGHQVTVPNVKPFELSGIKTATPQSGMTPGAFADHLENQNVEDAPRTEEPAEETSEEAMPPTLSLYVSTKDKMLEVRSGGQLVAAFPVTLGSQHTESPVGQWTVKGIAKLPKFRYDLKMLKDGERSSNFRLLPPGPNNPVGVIWIELDKKGIGIHGSSDPDLIGRNASHGCIRLANWDVEKLAGMIHPGVPVVVE